MKCLLLLSGLLASHFASGQILGTNLHQTNILAGYLEGELQVRHASDRPAARVYFLIYAAALDRYSTQHKDVLASDAALSRRVQDAKSRALLTFDRYSERVGGGFTPIVDRKRELADLERFVASGYSGELKHRLLAYILELKK